VPTEAFRESSGTKCWGCEISGAATHGGRSRGGLLAVHHNPRLSLGFALKISDPAFVFAIDKIFRNSFFFYPFAVITPQLALTASALTETLEMAPESLPKLVPLFAAGLVHAQRQMVLRLLDVESDWPWNK